MRVLPAFGVAALAVAGACYHATELATTWQDPSVQPVHFRKTVAVFVTKDQALRRSVEDRIASQFPGGTPSYRLMPTIKETENDAIVDDLRGKGYDGAVVMRVVDVENTATYVPGTYWYGEPYAFGPYWRNAWAYPYDPGYVRTDKVVSVETQVYSLTKDKLLFAARSETTNPNNAGHLTDSVLRHVTKELRKRGFLS